MEKDINEPLATPVQFVDESWSERILGYLAGALALGVTFFAISMRSYIRDTLVYGYLGIFALSILGNATLFFPMPSFALAIAAGDVLNPLLVGIAAGCGAAIGEMTGYFGGIAGRKLVKRRFERWYIRMETLLKQRGVFGVFILGLIPNPLFDIAGILAGTSGMPWWKFLVATALGKSLRYIGVALFGMWIL